MLINESRKSLIRVPSSPARFAPRKLETSYFVFYITFRDWSLQVRMRRDIDFLSVEPVRQTGFNHNDVIDDKYVFDCWLLLPRLTLYIFLSKNLRRQITVVYSDIRLTANYIIN